MFGWKKYSELKEEDKPRRKRIGEVFSSGVLFLLGSLLSFLLKHSGYQSWAHALLSAVIIMPLIGVLPKLRIEHPLLKFIVQVLIFIIVGVIWNRLMHWYVPLISGGDLYMKD